MAILGPHQAPIVNRAGAFGVASVWQNAGTRTIAPFVVAAPRDKRARSLLTSLTPIDATDRRMPF
jgi:hypothetical protein